MDAILANDGLGMLPALLRQTRACIAGSYTLQAALGNHSRVWPSSDVDVWVRGAEHVATYAVALLALGYDLPFVNGTTNSTYVRLRTSVSQIITFAHTTMPKVQVLVLTRDEPVVTDFDLVMLQCWYDGHELRATEAAAKDQRARHLTLNSAAVQDAASWFRTLRRVRKYEARGFKVVVPLVDWYAAFEVVLAYFDGTRLLGPIVYASAFTAWNSAAAPIPGVPLAFVALGPDATTAEDVRVVLSYTAPWRPKDKHQVLDLGSCTGPERALARPRFQSRVRSWLTQNVLRWSDRLDSYAAVASMVAHRLRVMPRTRAHPAPLTCVLANGSVMACTKYVERDPVSRIVIGDGTSWAIGTTRASLLLRTRVYGGGCTRDTTARRVVVEQDLHPLAGVATAAELLTIQLREQATNPLLYIVILSGDQDHTGFIHARTLDSILVSRHTLFVIRPNLQMRVVGHTSLPVYKAFVRQWKVCAKTAA